LEVAAAVLRFLLESNRRAAPRGVVRKPV